MFVRTYNISMCLSIFEHILSSSKDMKKEEILVFSLPTCEPDKMKECLLPSFKNFQEMKDYCTFCISFQPPYTNDEIKEVLEELDKYGYHYKYVIKKYEFKKGETPLIKMRQELAEMIPNAMFYGLLDDDMAFEEGTNKEGYTIGLQYLNVIKAMLEHRDIGFVLGKKRTSVRNVFNNNITYTKIKAEEFYTGKGLIYRGGRYYGWEGIYPKELHHLIGGNQDVLGCLIRLKEGDSSCEMRDMLCTHYENRNKPGMVAHGWNACAQKPNSIKTYCKEHFNENLFCDFLNFDDMHIEEIYNGGTKKIYGFEDKESSAIMSSNDKEYLIKEIDRMIANEE